MNTSKLSKCIPFIQTLKYQNIKRRKNVNPSSFPKHNKFSYFYVARKPPSIGRVTPFTIAAFSLSRKRIQLTTSSTSANRPRGILASMGPALAGSDHPTLPMAVMVTVGLTAFTRMLFGPSSRAATLKYSILISDSETLFDSYLVIMSRAPFVPQ